MTKLWVFGYGSLMWRPGFAFEEAHAATIAGVHRSLCVYSTHHRGTGERPGLVLGLDHGGSCRGIAYGIGAGNASAVLEYLRERELVTNIYREVTRPIRLEILGRPRVPAVTFVVRHDHPQYAGVLSWPKRLAMVEGAVGASGPNRDYVLNTVGHLRGLGINDDALEWLAARLAKSSPAGRIGARAGLDRA